MTALAIPVIAQVGAVPACIGAAVLTLICIALGIRMRRHAPG